ncbi:hypothetical protein HO133_009956 [Letharia lupina]|uniref:Major facilitator superfamily (MFS) profile domain-containing protein n=1 Tax=Letharia lupina TaxID=560253 RepID=A0A8H6CJN8_9LECA|nr:uncharacterized protein HO133_009956 [Letharia lupina]KAF6224762.1 hypothetical protein HO133_009956 [Letharia lupina]
MESYATEAPEIASDPAKFEKDSGFRSLEAESATQDRVDRHVVDFDGPDDPENPLNWSNTRKWCLVGLISAMTLVTNLATLMCAPAAPLILREFSSNNQLYQTLLVSIWELGEAFGPLFIAPLSEIYGRAPVYNAVNILFCIFSIAGAVSTNMHMFIAFRFLNGITVGAIVLNPCIVGDLFVTERRGNAMAIEGIAPLIGPVLGPVIGGYVSQAIGWRWLFWLAAIFAGVTEIGFLAFFRETYKVRILERKAARLRKVTGDDSYRSVHHVTHTIMGFLTVSVMRPARMLFLSPVIFLLGLYVALVYAYTYVLLTTMTEVFEQRYGFSTGSASLTFLGLGIGLTAGLLLCQATLDRYVSRAQTRGAMTPEQRLPPMIAGGLVIPAALLWYGWTVQARAPWTAPVVATATLGFGVAATVLPAFSYLVDAFGLHSASAVAATICLRCVAGAAFPLVAPSLYDRLGVGWGTSVLAVVALVFLPVPLLLMRFGERVRLRSRLLVTY